MTASSDRSTFAFRALWNSGKVIANTSSARIRQAPSKRPPKNDTTAPSVAVATSGSMQASSSVPGPGGVRSSDECVSLLGYKAKTG